MQRLGICVSGGGTNLQAIMDAIDNKLIRDTEIALVISNKENAFALARARKAGIPAQCISPKAYATREAFGEAMVAILREYKVDLVVLAGYLVIIPKILVKNYPDKIINIHPSLIPAHCGMGYYGLKVHESVLAAGNKVTGATVHFVDEEADHGPILLQKAVDVREGDTPEVLQKRVMEQAEWKILPYAIDLIGQGRVEIVDGIAHIKDSREE
ncbi:MAG: phosphoribosylglycinamide formyltransferase [Lachnospiraceae bacterium]|jgi:phosphoribosylglycinamide formyltransferase, formyltetrahydrofolate-dependent|nr:phosphoribosylglycinamide formyltransferase [Lachnospiraceae bacterium]RKI29900.1 phosphoribosylglycinamide formyltransferase [bacterium D16-36]RKI71985.1 phosphoribosylglycinamide formyltransferase [bacterium 1xD8-6]